jgi:hypothetical protein
MDCGWIDVKVRLPDRDMDVLITNANWSPRHYEAIYHKDKNIFEISAIPIDATHWLEIPPPPNKG